MPTNGYRVETDSTGTLEVPVDAYYGVQSLRGYQNFRITGRKIHHEIINSLAYLKKASALANSERGLIDEKIAAAIVQACDEILAGKFHDAFIVDPIQGGAGTSLNMNANEVIANRASEILGGKKGDYTLVHPNNHVNYGQSTNDVIPTAGKMTALTLIKGLETETARLVDAFNAKADEFANVLKMGRTQMQDAVPITLGQEFKAYADAVKRGLNRVTASEDELKTINMGGTAIGTGINADEEYLRIITPILNKVSSFDLRMAEDLVDSTQSLDPLVAVSGAIKTLAVTLSKIANDLRLMSSGPRTGFAEITLPAKQNGSSIMPAKVNPVIPEVVSQVAFLIVGHDVTITMAAEGGQLELNAFEPVAFSCLFESITSLQRAVNTFVDNCVVGITANREHCLELVEHSVGTITALCPHIGYQAAADIAKKSLATGESVRSLVIKEKLLTEEELNLIMNAEEMTKPGIPGKKLLKK